MDGPIRGISARHDDGQLILGPGGRGGRGFGPPGQMRGEPLVQDDRFGGNRPLRDRDGRPIDPRGGGDRFGDRGGPGPDRFNDRGMGGPDRFGGGFDRGMDRRGEFERGPPREFDRRWVFGVLLYCFETRPSWSSDECYALTLAAESAGWENGTRLRRGHKPFSLNGSCDQQMKQPFPISKDRNEGLVKGPRPVLPHQRSVFARPVGRAFSRGQHDPKYET